MVSYAVASIKSMSSLKKHTCTLLLFWYVASLLLSAGPPAQSPGGTLQGIVTDSTGARVPLAKVVMRAAAPHQERAIEADSHGEFRLADLEAGVYEIKVTAPGFAGARSAVKVAIS